MRDQDVPRFGRGQAERILRRAVELEHRSPPEAFDLQELREVAAEVGVSPTSVERAALELAPTPASLLMQIAGGPAALRMEGEFSGVIRMEDAARVGSAIERSLGRSGRMEQSLEGLVWRASDPFGSILVGMSAPPDGNSRIRITADRSGAAQLTWILSGAGALLTAVAAQNHMVGLGAAELMGLWSASALGGGVVARGIWSRISHGWRNRLIGLLGQMQRMGSEGPEKTDP
jgi:hypothetical protein